jgi:hypothetical protein
MKIFDKDLKKFGKNKFTIDKFYSCFLGCFFIITMLVIIMKF